jgi:octopine/nopaline transport system substrate-binding protein
MTKELLRKLILNFVMFAALILPLTAIAQDYKHIKIATEGAFAPFNYKDASGNLVGFEIDLAADLCRRMGIKHTMLEQAWDGMIPSLVAGKYDAIMAGMSIKAEREKVISFSRDYAAQPAVFVVLKTSPIADLTMNLNAITFDDINADEKAVLGKMRKAFKGKTVGVMVSSTHASFMDEIMPEIETKSYDIIDNAILDLNSGRLDIALVSVSFFTPLMKKPVGKKSQTIGPFLSKGPYGRGTGVGIRHEDGKLRQMFTKAIYEAMADGTLSRLAIKWFEVDISPKE